MRSDRLRAYSRELSVNCRQPIGDHAGEKFRRGEVCRVCRENQRRAEVRFSDSRASARVFYLCGATNCPARALMVRLPQVFWITSSAGPDIWASSCSCKHPNSADMVHPSPFTPPGLRPVTPPKDPAVHQARTTVSHLNLGPPMSALTA